MAKKTKLRILKQKDDANSGFWALLTIVAFPLAMFLADRLTASTIWIFVSGMLGSIAVLCLQQIVEQRVWIFDPSWRARFESPDFSFRLAIITGAILLILETSLLVIFIADRTLDQSVFNLILSRECTSPSLGFRDICELFLSRLRP